MKGKIQIISWYYYENSFALVDSLKESQESPDHTLKSTAFCHGCPSVVPKSEISTSPGNLSEMKILWLHLKPTTWDPLGGGGRAVKPHHLGFIRPCWWFWCSLRFAHHCANKLYRRRQDNGRKTPAGSRKSCFYSTQDLIVLSLEEKLKAECRGRTF